MHDEELFVQERLKKHEYNSSHTATVQHPRSKQEGGKYRCPDCGAVSRDPTILAEIPCTATKVAPELVPSVSPPTIRMMMIGQRWLEIGRKVPWVLIEDRQPWGPNYGWMDPSTKRMRGIPLRKEPTRWPVGYDDAVTRVYKESTIFDISSGDKALRLALVDARIDITRDGIIRGIAKAKLFRVSPFDTEITTLDKHITIRVETKVIPLPDY